jgi:nicotinate-nucleotide adenylyltransferase
MIGILGGTFDPPHKAHLEIAQYLLDYIPLEKILFIPCYLPALKSSPHASPKHRLNMVKIMISGNSKLNLDTRELIKKNLSYTIDTLASIRQEIGPIKPLCFIMGLDAFNHFLKWKDWEGILKLCHIIVINRPGYIKNQEPNFTHYLEIHQTHKKEELLSIPAGKILLCAFSTRAISSTEIRTAILKKLNKKIKNNLSPGVEEYIITHQLYLI